MDEIHYGIATERKGITSAEDAAAAAARKAAHEAGIRSTPFFRELRDGIDLLTRTPAAKVSRLEYYMDTPSGGTVDLAFINPEKKAAASAHISVYRNGHVNLFRSQPELEELVGGGFDPFEKNFSLRDEGVLSNVAARLMKTLGGEDYAQFGNRKALGAADQIRIAHKTVEGLGVLMEYAGMLPKDTTAALAPVLQSSQPIAASLAEVGNSSLRTLPRPNTAPDLRNG